VVPHADALAIEANPFYGAVAQVKARAVVEKGSGARLANWSRLDEWDKKEFEVPLLSIAITSTIDYF